MKAQRLFSILNILLDRRKISASELAVEFGVSIRTIYRDIDALSLAGIPVYSTTGRDGGFALIEGFTIDRQVLKTGEVQKILASIEGLSGALTDAKTGEIRDKFRRLLRKSKEQGIPLAPGHIFIELAPPLKERETIEIIERAINDCSCLDIDYYDSSNSRTRRSVEPLALVYIWNCWYLYAYCRMRNGFRLFRIARILSAKFSPEARKAPYIDLSAKPWLNVWDGDKSEEIVLETTSDQKNRICELIEWSSIRESGNNTIEVTFSIPLTEWGLSVIMSLPGKFRILKPEKVRIIIKKRAGEILSENSDI